MQTKLQKEENRVSEIKKKYSKEGLEEILELANAHVKESGGSVEDAGDEFELMAILDSYFRREQK